jgi:ATP-dependent DNA ligase
VKLYSRPGNDLPLRFPLIVDALARLRSRSCIIDGEAVSCGADGIANFDRIRYRRNDADVFMWAFDLIDLNGDDLRRDPLAVRKVTLERMIAGSTARHTVQRAFGRGGRPACVPSRLQAGPRRASCRSAATRPTVPAGRGTG